MVLNTPVFDDKENVLFKPAQSQSVLGNTNGRRPLSRTNNTPSPVTRENSRDPRRRHTQSPPAATNTLDFAVDSDDSDVEMLDVGTPSGSNSPQPRIQLPRYLGRPDFKGISPAALEAVDADLKGVAMVYLHEKLQSFGKQLLAVAATTTMNPPRHRLPRELEVMINDIAGDAPTHLFAVFSRRATRISIHPAHALVLAAHCANLPVLPYSKPARPAQVGSMLTLPVVPLPIPSPETFPILLHYLYTKQVDNLLGSLLPTPLLPHATQSPDRLSRILAATFTVEILLTHAARVHGLWSNVAALGVFDEKLWRGIEVLWGELLDALAITTGSTWQTED